MAVSHQRVYVIGLAIFLSGAIAANASAATLKIKVPNTVKTGHKYTITLKATVSQSQVGFAYLIGFNQFSGGPCKGSFSAENNVATSRLFYSKRIPTKNFTYTSAPATASAKGPRHVCGYIYRSQDASKPPIAKADKAYKVV